MSLHFLREKMTCSWFAQHSPSFVRYLSSPTLFRCLKTRIISSQEITVRKELAVRCFCAHTGLLSKESLKEGNYSEKTQFVKDAAHKFHDKSKAPSGLAVSNNRLMLIDGTSIIYRAYYKLIASLHHGAMEDADGNGDWALTFFRALSMILDMMEFYPSHMAVVFDHDGVPFRCQNFNSSKDFFLAKGKTFRHTLYPEYKGNRNPTPDTVIQALQYLRAALEATSLRVIEVPGVEADDVIGTLAVNAVNEGFKVRIVSPDKDFFQILGPSLRLLRLPSRGSGLTSFGIEQFAEIYGNLKPSQHIDVMALSGDLSDNVPGVKGIGQVHAVKFITQYGSLENLLQNLSEIPETTLRESLSANRERAIMSKELVTLRSNLPSYIVPFKTSDLALQKPKDGGEMLMKLVSAVNAFTDGSSAKKVAGRLSDLWKKY